MYKRSAGICLVAAASLFWLAWLLMPGVGVTDARQIFQLVRAARAQVAAAVVLQLLSAAAYVPAGLGIAACAELAHRPGIAHAIALLLIGAIGSGSDAVLHLLAYAMTAPNVDSPSLVSVMEFMQGPGLQLLGPLLACFFIGGAWLSFEFAAAGFMPRAAAHLHTLALGIALAGGALVGHGSASGRLVGLVTLGAVSVAQAWTGLALFRRRSRAVPPRAPNRLRPASRVGRAAS